MKQPRRPSDAALGLVEGDLVYLKRLLGDRCEICGRVCELHIDHLHGSSVFRGLLCFSCNTTLGNLQDDPAVLTSALLYLLERGNEAGRLDEELVLAAEKALGRFGFEPPDLLNELEDLELKRRTRLKQSEQLKQKLEEERKRLSELKLQTVQDALKRLNLD